MLGEKPQLPLAHATRRICGSVDCSLTTAEWEVDTSARGSGQSNRCLQDKGMAEREAAKLRPGGSILIGHIPTLL